MIAWKLTRAFFTWSPLFRHFEEFVGVLLGFWTVGDFGGIPMTGNLLMDHLEF